MSKRTVHPPLTISTPVRKVRRSNNFPISPTDGIVSPCTQKLYNLRSRHSTGSRFFSLESAVHRKPYPGGDTKLILGTSSVGRRAVVDALEWTYERMSPDIDEKSIRSSDPMEMPVLIALAKAKALMNRLKESHSTEPAYIVTADEIVLYKGAVWVRVRVSGDQAHGVDVATVYWSEVSPATIDKVVKKGAILNSAGGFCVEDPDLNNCVASLDGTVDSIMGLPVALTEKLLVEVAEKRSKH